MAKSTITVTLLYLINTLVAFVSQLIIASIYGASSQTDAYYLASTLPLIIANIFSNMSTTAVVPIFTEILVQRGESLAWKFVSSLSGFLIGSLCVLAVVGSFLSQTVIRLTAPGLTPEQIGLSAGLFQVYCLITILMCFNNMLVVLHNTFHRFSLPAACIVLPNIGIVAGALLLTPFIGIWSLVIGQLVGVCVQILILSPKIVGREKLHLSLNYRISELSSAIKMLSPLLLGGALYQFIPSIERFFASGLSQGNITYLSLANRIGTVAGPPIVTGLSTTLFPRLSFQAANRDMNKAYATLSLSLRLYITVSMPIVVLSIAYAFPLIHLLLRRGAFSTTDADAVAKILPFYIIAASAGAFGTLIGRGFYSLLQDTLTPSINGVAFVFLYTTLCWFLVPWYGYVGLAIAYALFWTLVIFSASLLLRHRLGIKGGKTVAKTLIRCFSAALLSCVATTTVLHYVSSQWLAIMVIVVGFLFYGILARFIFQVAELRFMVDRFFALSYQVTNKYLRTTHAKDLVE